MFIIKIHKLAAETNQTKLFDNISGFFSKLTYKFLLLMTAVSEFVDPFMTSIFNI